MGSPSSPPRRACIGVDVGARTRKAVACLLIEDAGGCLAIAGWHIGTGDLRAFAEGVRKLARAAEAMGAKPVIVIEDQFVKFVAAAKKLIEARMWVRVIAEVAGFEVFEVVASEWQADVLHLSPIKPTKSDKRTKERAYDVCRKVWPCLALTEDQADAALIALWRLRLRGSRPAARSRSRRRPTGRGS